MFRIRELAIAWQQIRFLTVLTAALPVALTGKGSYPRLRPADLPGNERHIGITGYIVGSLMLLLDSPRKEDNRFRSFAVDLSCANQLLWSNPRNLTCILWCEFLHDLCHFFKSACVLADEILICISTLNEQVHHTVGQRQIRTRTQIQMNVCSSCNRRLTWIGYNEVTAAALNFPYSEHGRRVTFCCIASCYEETICLMQIRPRQG
ncbi:hypothetical protein D3C81_957240 [compost metagenome]